jgi:hypothetical protein
MTPLNLFVVVWKWGQQTAASKTAGHEMKLSPKVIIKSLNFFEKL